MERLEAAPLRRPGRARLRVHHGYRDWSTFWPGYVRLEEGSRCGASGDTAQLVTRLLGRERELAMTIKAFEPNRLVSYTSTQPGLPDACQERHFESDDDGFV